MSEPAGRWGGPMCVSCRPCVACSAGLRCLTPEDNNLIIQANEAVNLGAVYLLTALLSSPARSSCSSSIRPYNFCA